MAKKYITHSNQFKFKVALEALKGDYTVTELCQKYELAPSQIYDWKKKLADIGPNVFSGKLKPVTNEKEIEKLHATIGRLKVENDFLAKVLDR